MKVYRVICYEIPDESPRSTEWMDRTIERSISGRYVIGGGSFSITAVVANEEELSPTLRKALAKAGERQWKPQITEHFSPGPDQSSRPS